MKTVVASLFILCLGYSTAFSPAFLSKPSKTALSDTSTNAVDEATTTNTASLDPKDAVKLFGRLAEKYIMLDPTGGMCCYSGCSDCEYRLPGGGYRMADQSASRPKWIPSYDERFFESSGKEHTSKWGTEIFTEGPAVTKDDFCSRMLDMAYAPPLGGPYISASAAKMDNTEAASVLFDILAGEKEKLTKHRMGTRIKEIAGGEEGLTWANFQKAMCGE